MIPTGRPATMTVFRSERQSLLVTCLSCQRAFHWAIKLNECRTAAIGGGGIPAWKPCLYPMAFAIRPALCVPRQSMCAFCTCFNHGFCTGGPPCQSCRAGTPGGAFTIGDLAGSAFRTGDLAGNDAMAMAGRFKTCCFLARDIALLPPAESILRNEKASTRWQTTLYRNLNTSDMHVMAM